MTLTSIFDLADLLPVVDGKAHKPDVAVAEVKLVNDRHRTVGQLDVIVEVGELTGLPQHDAVFTRL